MICLELPQLSRQTKHKICVLFGEVVQPFEVRQQQVATQILKTLRTKRSRISNLLKLEFSGEAHGYSIDEVGEGERSTTIPVRKNKDITDNQGHLYAN